MTYKLFEMSLQWLKQIIFFSFYQGRIIEVREVFETISAEVQIEF